MILIQEYEIQSFSTQPVLIEINQRDSNEQRFKGLTSRCVTPPRIHSRSRECP
jgi:hypothetical protein